MIVQKKWFEYQKFAEYVKRFQCEGWYLFGFIPMFIYKEEIEPNAISQKIKNADSNETKNH